MSQSRKGSVVEASVNQAVGISLSVGLNATVLPLFGFNATAFSLTAVTLVYFVASFVRTYALRRIFNHFHTHHPKETA